MRIAGLVLVVVLVAACATQREGVVETKSKAKGSDVVEPPNPADFATAGADVEFSPPSSAGADEGPMRRADGGGDMIGSNGQPEWTLHQRFVTTPAYVMAPGQVHFQQWMTTATPRHEGPNHSWLSEVGMGFEGGFEAHVGEDWGRPAGGPTKHVGVRADVGYALGKWGAIPFNPSLYAGYEAVHRAPDFFNVGVGVADEVCGGEWIWAGDVIWQQETGDGRHRDLGADFGIAHPLTHDWSLGAEARYDNFAARHVDGSDDQFLIGPSLQWRPTDNTHLDVAPLFGVTKGDRRDPRMELFLVFGIDFGAAHSRPTSTR